MGLIDSFFFNLDENILIMYIEASNNLSRAKMPIVPGNHLPSLALTLKKGKEVYSQAAPKGV